MKINLSPEELKIAQKTAKDARDKALLAILAQAEPRLRQAIALCPSRYQYDYALSLTSSASRANSIKMTCYECVGFEDIQNQVGHCTVKTCPLWQVRPVRYE